MAGPLPAEDRGRAQRRASGAPEGGGGTAGARRPQVKVAPVLASVAGRGAPSFRRSPPGRRSRPRTVAAPPPSRAQRRPSPRPARSSEASASPAGPRLPLRALGGGGGGSHWRPARRARGGGNTATRPAHTHRRAGARCPGRSASARNTEGPSPRSHAAREPWRARGAHSRKAAGRAGKGVPLRRARWPPQCGSTSLFPPRPGGAEASGVRRGVSTTTSTSLGGRREEGPTGPAPSALGGSRAKPPRATRRRLNLPRNDVSSVDSTPAGPRRLRVRLRPDRPTGTPLESPAPWLGPTGTLTPHEPFSFDVSSHVSAVRSRSLVWSVPPRGLGRAPPSPPPDSDVPGLFRRDRVGGTEGITDASAPPSPPVRTAGPLLPVALLPGEALSVQTFSAGVGGLPGDLRPPTGSPV